MLRIRRVFAALALSAAFAWLGAAPAGASENPHDRLPATTPPDVTVTCPQGFTVVAHESLNKEYTKVFVLQDGTIRYQINGDATSTVSGNGQVLTFNTSGPGAVFVRSDSLTFVEEGHLFYIGANFVGAWLYTGLVVIDGSGNIVSASGNVTDICAVLAG